MEGIKNTVHCFLCLAEEGPQTAADKTEGCSTPWTAEGTAAAARDRPHCQACVFIQWERKEFIMIRRLSWPLCLFSLDATMDKIHLYMKCHGNMMIYSEVVTDSIVGINLKRPLLHGVSW